MKPETAPAAAFSASVSTNCNIRDSQKLIEWLNITDYSVFPPQKGLDMSKIRIFSVAKIALKPDELSTVKLPETGFSVVIDVNKSLEALIADNDIRATLEATAVKNYNTFLRQTARELKEFDKLFAGMLAKGAAPEEVEKQADMLKNTLENETLKWEKAARHDVSRALAKLAKKKR